MNFSHTWPRSRGWYLTWFWPDLFTCFDLQSLHRTFLNVGDVCPAVFLSVYVDMMLSVRTQPFPFNSYPIYSPLSLIPSSFFYTLIYFNVFFHLFFLSTISLSFIILIVQFVQLLSSKNFLRTDRVSLPKEKQSDTSNHFDIFNCLTPHWRKLRTTRANNSSIISNIEI